MGIPSRQESYVLQLIGGLSFSQQTKDDGYETDDTELDKENTGSGSQGMPSVIKSQWLTGLASSSVKKATSSPFLFIPLFWSWAPQQHGIDLQNNTDAKRVSIFVYKTDFKAFPVNTNPMSGGLLSFSLSLGSQVSEMDPSFPTQ